MDRWGWDQLHSWLEIRRELPIGALLCVIHGPTAGRRWEASAARKQLHHAAAAAGVRRRFAPHHLRHAHAVEMAHEGVPLVVIQRQLGHANLGITSIDLQGIDSSEIISTVHGRPSPTISASAGLQMRREITARHTRGWRIQSLSRRRGHVVLSRSRASIPAHASTHSHGALRTPRGPRCGQPVCCGLRRGMPMLVSAAHSSSASDCGVSVRFVTQAHGGASVIERADDRAPQPVRGERQLSFVVLPAAISHGRCDGPLKRVRRLAQAAKAGCQILWVTGGSWRADDARRRIVTHLLDQV